MNGPLFTSKAHPWPQATNGYYLVPIAQIDLAEATALSGRAFGTGIAQMWQGDRIVTRLIPDRDVSISLLSEPPQFVAGSTLEPWLLDEDADQPAFLTNTHQVTGYAGPYLFGPAMCDDLLNGYIADPRCSDVLSTALVELRDAVLDGRARFRQINCLLGSFDSIQHQPEDLPPVLFSSADDGVLNTGDAGNLVMFADVVKGAVQLSGVFECY